MRLVRPDMVRKRPANFYALFALCVWAGINKIILILLLLFRLCAHIHTFRLQRRRGIVIHKSFAPDDGKVFKDFVAYDLLLAVCLTAAVYIFSFSLSRRRFNNNIHVLSNFIIQGICLNYNMLPSYDDELNQN